jgi:hypothetical protein
MDLKIFMPSKNSKGIPSNLVFRPKDLLLSISLAILTLVGFALCYIRYFHGGMTFEFCHYAEIASHILHGEGYTTRMYMPFDLAFLESKGIPVALLPSAFVVYRFPLFAY